MLWRAFTWYYRLCFRMIDRGLQEERDRRDRLTEDEKRKRSEQKRHSLQTIGWIGWIICLFYIGIPMLIGELTRGFVDIDIPRAEWLMAWVIFFWIYYVFVAWRDQPK